VVHLENGRLCGGDSVMSYAGYYEISGDRFSATLTMQRHTAGQATVFGTDDVQLRLEGLSKGTIAHCTGHTDAVPGLVFEATLIPRQADPEPRRVGRRPGKFDPTKLPPTPTRPR
jgi:hypothetical protein